MAKLKRSKPAPFYSRHPYLTATGAAFATFGLFLAWLASGPSASPPDVAVLAGARQKGVSKAAFLRLQTGISYAQAVGVLGAEGDEEARSDTAGIVTVSYRWKGQGMIGANMSAMFQNDKLVTKAQVGLE